MTNRVADWPHANLGEIARGGVFTDGDWIETKDQDPSGDVRLTQLADVGVASFRDRSDRWLREDQAARLGCTFLEPCDILIARMPDPIGRACLVPAAIGRAVTAVDVAVLRIQRADVDPRFVMWAINSPDFHTRVVALQSGTTRKRISRRNLSALTVPLPPIGEQRRIVDILDDHLSRIDAGVAELGVQRLKVVGLEAAFIRWLVSTAAESGRVSLLSDVSTVTAGRTPRGLEGRLAENPRVDRTVPFYKVGDMNSDPRFLATARTFLAADEVRDLGLATISAGAVVMPKAGGAIATNKKRIVRIPGPVDLNCLAVIPGPELLPDYLHTWFLQVDLRRLSDGSVLPQLSKRKIEGLRVPVPSLESQAELTMRLDATSAQTVRLAQAVGAAERRADALRRALLQAAFSGRLTGASSDVDRVEELAGV